MSNELNWFHISRWRNNRMTRQMHDRQMTREMPERADKQVFRALAENNVIITRSDQEEEDEKRKQNDNKDATETPTLDSTQRDSSPTK